MRRRFGRRRGRTSETRQAVDPGVLERIVERGLVPARVLEPVGADDVPASLAALGRSDDGSLLVGFAPEKAVDALLAATALGLRLREQTGFQGSVHAVAPCWSPAARRVLAWLAPRLPFVLEAHEASELGAGGGRVEPVPERVAGPVPVRAVSRQAGSAAARALFERAVEGLRGLAAKHGGALRAWNGAVELVLLAQRVALLRPGARAGADPALEISGVQTLPVTDEGLSDALDRLEGQMRKHLNDRRSREGEEGWRARAVGPTAEEAGLRDLALWPAGGREVDAVDALAVAPDGTPVLVAARREFGLADLRDVLEAAATLEAFLPGLLAEAEPPVQLGPPRLVLAAGSLAASARSLLGCLALEVAVYQLDAGRARPTRPTRIDLGGAAPAVPLAGAPGAAAEPAASPPRSRPSAAAAAASAEPGETPAAQAREQEAEGPARRSSGFDEVSLFDLEEESARSDEGGRRRGRRRRARGRGRARRGGGEAETPEPHARPGARAEEAAERAGPTPSDRRESRRGRRRQDESDWLVEGRPRRVLEDDADEALVPLAPDAPEFEAEPRPEVYEDEEEVDEDAAEARLHREREQRRRARLAKGDPAPEAEPEPTPRAPRRRAAVVTHADRDSLAAAVLLARDLRLLEGLWVYPQADLMTFFRSVATDLRDDTPIYLIGFTPSPARDVIQAASLYRGRITWFDHHAWPPEDMGALRAALGEDALHLTPGACSSLPAVAAVSTRRSRFSDKLLDLATSRFTLHDYERWGRLWWGRLGEIAARPGERRADVEPLLAGRPSELAREASGVPAPELPPEAGFAARQDFRLVHFGGWSLVVVPVPEELDLCLAARIVRERYAAPLSLAHPANGGVGLVVLGADEAAGRRGVHLDALVAHLAGKFAWVEVLPDEDHVARLRVREGGDRAERLDELLAEIAMARSLLEG